MKAAHLTAGQNNAHQSQAQAPHSKVVGNTELGLLVNELRAQALTLERGNLPLIGSLYGLVLETALIDRVTSLVSLTDGSTSWYVSSGHGCIGCGADVDVNHAAKQLIATANELVVDAPLAMELSPPNAEGTRLFLLAVDGLRSIGIPSASTHNLASAALTTLLLNAQRLLQLIERRRAGVSLEEQLTVEVTKLAAANLSSSLEVLSSASNNTAPLVNLECLSVGNAARRLRT